LEVFVFVVIAVCEGGRSSNWNRKL